MTIITTEVALQKQFKLIEIKLREKTWFKNQGYF